jgi:radical SAM protein with 4Fe4S-binding SPASM domain
MTRNIKPPSLVQIELTNECNLRCVHCYAASGKKRANELTTLELKNLISDLHDFGVPRIALSGGEPLLHPDFLDLLRLAKDQGFSVGINSNGSMLTSEIAKMLHISQLDLFSISLHGIRKETHDSICGAGSYDDALDGINTALRFNLPLTISCMISKQNYSEIPLIYRYAIALGVKEIVFLRFHAVGRGRGRHQLLHIDNQAHKRVVDELLRIASERNYLPFRLEAPFINADCSDDQESDTISCKAGIEICTVTSDGDVIGCNILRDRFLVAGNIRTNDFGRIWSESRSFSTLRDIRDNWEQVCPGCTMGHRCRAGCRAVAVTNGRDIFANDPYCWKHEEIV